MTPEELSKGFSNKTHIQQVEHLKTIAETEVQIIGQLLVVEKDYISIINEEPKLPFSMRLTIKYEGETLFKQLLNYSTMDRVQLSAKCIGVSFGESSDYYTFNLISIIRTNT